MAERAWIVWYEDPESSGDPHIFLSQASAEARIKELLIDIIGDLERDFDFSEEAGDEREEQGSQLNDVKQLLAQGAVMEALEEWKAFAESFLPDQNVIVRRADIIP